MPKRHRVRYEEEESKRMAQERERGERVDKKKAIRVHIEYKESDEKLKDELVEKIKANVPEAKVTSEVGEGDCFEVHYNHKKVHSKRELKRFPNVDEMVEIAYWMNQGKNFMHMYLCSFVEGGEPNMVIADRKKTPLAKRLILSCTIS